MKLLLSSNGQTAVENFHLLSAKRHSALKIAWVITATKQTSNLNYINGSLETFFKYGYTPTIYDIENKTLQDFRNDLKNYDILFIEGGSPAFLLKTVKATQFDKFIKEWIKTKPYASTSAGTYIMCPTIEMAFWHKPNRNRFGLTDLTALNVVPYLITVHYTPQKGKLLKPHAIKSDYKIRLLKDGQALLIEDSEITLVGDQTKLSL